MSPSPPGSMADRPAHVEVGLCAHCLHARIIQSTKSSRFYLCGLAASDEQFTKYPRLPVTACTGYESAEGAAPRLNRDLE